MCHAALDLTAQACSMLSVSCCLFSARTLLCAQPINSAVHTLCRLPATCPPVSNSIACSKPGDVHCPSVAAICPSVSSVLPVITISWSQNTVRVNHTPLLGSLHMVTPVWQQPQLNNAPTCTTWYGFAAASASTVKSRAHTLTRTCHHPAAVHLPCTRHAHTYLPPAFAHAAAAHAGD
jgi:hypothetical protein